MGDEDTVTLVLAVMAEWTLQDFFDLILPDDETAAASTLWTVVVSGSFELFESSLRNTDVNFEDFPYFFLREGSLALLVSSWEDMLSKVCLFFLRK